MSVTGPGNVPEKIRPASEGLSAWKEATGAVVTTGTYFLRSLRLQASRPWTGQLAGSGFSSFCPLKAPQHFSVTNGTQNSSLGLPSARPRGTLSAGAPRDSPAGTRPPLPREPRELDSVLRLQVSWTFLLSPAFEEVGELAMSPRVRDDRHGDRIPRTRAGQGAWLPGGPGHQAEWGRQEGWASADLVSSARSPCCSAPRGALPRHATPGGRVNGSTLGSRAQRSVQVEASLCVPEMELRESRDPALCTSPSSVWPAQLLGCIPDGG